jgi:hypothetical protein
MWNSLCDTLTPESAQAFLDSLPDDLKAVIRAEYGLARDGFVPPPETEFREVKQVIARWCEEASQGS